MNMRQPIFSLSTCLIFHLLHRQLIVHRPMLSAISYVHTLACLNVSQMHLV